MAELLETAMLVAFGAAWPASIVKSWKSGTARGKSLAFLVIVEIGYGAGLSAKLFYRPLDYVVAFYILDALLVFVEILIYGRNRARDRLADQLASASPSQPPLAG
jgi:hypothetical protein